ncbi:MAG: hypothetical protein Q4C50_03265 [Eubacteriales bacterium]|nr:hypothetical protein [Eubacteriales bacterium]
MAVKASPEVIREMKKDIQDTSRELERISSGISRVLDASPEWNDAQSEQFRALMKKIAGLTAEPIGTLQASIPKMEKLAQALDEYSRVKF